MKMGDIVFSKKTYDFGIIVGPESRSSWGTLHTRVHWMNGTKSIYPFIWLEMVDECG